jgi:hypothetical protein
MYTILPINSVLLIYLILTNYDENINILKRVLDKFMVSRFNIILDWLDIKFLSNLNKKTLACLEVLLPLSL